MFSRRARSIAPQPISRLMAEALARPEIISLAAGFVDPVTLPQTIVAEATAEILAEAGTARAALQYGTTAGDVELRQAVRDRTLSADRAALGRLAPAVRPTDPVPAAPIERTVITAGSNQLLHLVAEATLDPGDVVYCAAPTYLVFLGLFENFGATAIGVATDDDGLDPDALERELSARQSDGTLGRVKLIYVVSDFDNPRAVTLPPDRRRRIVELAKRFSTPDHVIRVIDDAAYRLLRYEGDDLPGLRVYDADGSTVVTAGTFSKTFSPGLRVGYGLLPTDLGEAVLGLKGNIDFGSPHFNQKVLARILTDGRFEPHVERLREAYRLKRDAMVEALATTFAGRDDVTWAVPAGGLYVWLTLPPGFSSGPEGPLLAAALHEGVLYVPGEYCYAGSGVPRQANTIRLSFGVQSAAGIVEGIRLLGRAIESVTVPT